MGKITAIFLFLFASAASAETQDDSVVLKLVSGGPDRGYAIGEWSLFSYKIEKGVIWFEYRNRENAAVEIALRPYDKDGEKYAQSKSYNIVYRTEEGKNYNQNSLIYLMNTVSKRVIDNDKGDIDLTKLVPREASNIEIVLHNLLYWMTLYLLLASFFMFLLTIPSMRDIVRKLGRVNGIIVFLIFHGGILIRFSIYPFFSDAGSLYALAADAASLTGLSRHNPVMIVVGSLIFKVFPVDHIYIAAINTFAGVLSITSITLFFRRFGLRLLACIIILTALSFSPLFIREHRSASDMVFAMFFLFTGMTLLIEHIEEKSDKHLAGAIVFFALAFLSKTVFVLITPLLITAMFYFKEGYFRWLRTSTKKACSAFLASVVLASPGIYMWIKRIAGSPDQIDVAGNLFNAFIAGNPLVSFDYFPAAISLLALVSLLILYKDRQAALLKPLLFATAISLAVNAPAMGGENFTGGQTLAAIFILAIASEGFQSLVNLRGANLKLYLFILGIAFAGTAAYNYEALLKETTAMREDRACRLCYSGEMTPPACKEIFDDLDFDSPVRCGLYKNNGEKLK